MRLIVDGEASAQLLLRTVNLLAQRGILPRHVDARVEGRRMRVLVEAELAAHAAAIIAEKLRTMVDVDAVVLEPTALTFSEQAHSLPLGKPAEERPQ